MNGVEMYQEIKKTWPKSRFLFLTGFMDFDYVYTTAAQDSNTRFLTKLEPEEKIISVLEEMFEELENSYKEQELMQKAMDQSQEAFPLLQNKYLGKFLYGRGKKEQLVESFRTYQIDLDVDGPLFLVNAAIDGAETDSGTASNYLEFALKTVMSTEFQQDHRICFYLSEEQESLFTCLIQKKRKDARKLQDLLENVQLIFKSNTGNTVSFAYGETNGNYLDNPSLFKRIRNVLGYRNPDITENIIPCSREEGGGSSVWENEGLQKSWNRMVHMDDLETYLEMGQEQSFFELFDQMVEHMDDIESMNYTLAQEIYYKIAVLLLRYINVWRLNEKIAFQVELYKLMRSDLHESWAEGVSFLRKTAQTIFSLYFETERTNLSGYVTDTREYIKDHMAEDLSLLLLADRIHLNASYLSRLFRKETGEKLYDYILRIRMQRAIELVMEGTHKVQDIAVSVGYESVQSFNRAFKKYTGESPINYRNR